MNVYVLIKTEMDEEFNFHTTVCGVYTKEGKEQFEKGLPEEGRKLKEQLHQRYMEDIDSFSNCMFSDSSNDRFNAFNNIMNRKIEEAKKKIITLDDYKTDEQLKNLYMYQNGYSWQVEWLVDG